MSEVTTMKKTYELPEVEIIEIVTENVLTGDNTEELSQKFDD